MLYSCRNGTTVFSFVQLIIVASYAVEMLSCHSCLTGQAVLWQNNCRNGTNFTVALHAVMVVGMEQLFFFCAINQYGTKSVV